MEQYLLYIRAYFENQRVFMSLRIQNNKISQQTSEKCKLIEKLVSLLRPFEELIKELSAVGVLVLSVIPFNCHFGNNS